MKKMLKNAYLAILCVLFIFSGAYSTYARNIHVREGLTVESYIEWVSELENLSEYQIDNRESFLTEFSNLSENEQELFVYYMNNDDIVLEILNSMSTSGIGYLAGGDIVIRVEDDTILHELNVNGIQNRRATASMSVSVLGLTVFEYRGEMFYSHNGRVVTRIDYSHIWIQRSFMPFTSFTWGGISSFGVNTPTATHRAHCTWNFVHSSLGLVAGHHSLNLTGNVQNVTRFFTN